MMNRIFYTKIIIILFTNLFHFGNVFGQKQVIEVFAYEGFFIRDSVDKKHFLDFNPNGKSAFVGCLVEGYIDSISNPKQISCRTIRTYSYEKIEKNIYKSHTSSLVKLHNIESLDTIKILKINQDSLVIEGIDKKSKLKFHYSFKREDKNPCNGDCIEFCPEAPRPYNTWQTFLLIRRYWMFVSIYLGIFFLLIWYRNVPGFMSSVLKIWLPLTLIYSVIFYSTQAGILLKEYVLHICNFIPKNYSHYTLLGFDFERNGKTIPKHSPQFWLIIFLFYSPLTLMTALWLSWKLYVSKFKISNPFLNRIAKTSYGSLSFILIFLNFFATSFFVVGSFSGFLIGYGPNNWILLMVSYIGFYFYFKFMIIKPFFNYKEINYRKLPEFFREIMQAIGG